jgi:polyferredoxin/Fe-S-cluster-containing dehydrogenase component
MSRFSSYLTMQNGRKVVQMAFFFFFLFLFLQARYPYEVLIQSDFGLRFSPMMPLFVFIDTLSIPAFVIPGLIILLFTPFLGRIFCSWICPLGTTLDAASRVLKPPPNRISERWNRLRVLKFVNLVGLIILAVFSVNLWGYLDPLSIFNRILTVLFYPVVTLFGENAILALGRLPFLENLSDSLYELFKRGIMPENQAYYAQVFGVTVFTAGIIGSEKIARRFWCRYMCPAGALLGFLSQFRFYERLVGEECPACELCVRECKMDAIPMGDVSKTNKIECVECFNCGAACPPKLNAITYRWNWKPYHTPVDYDRRRFLQTSLGSVGALGLLSIGLTDRKAEAGMIRPPGAVAEADFREKCIRCLECVRICESNGGCLQPDSIHNHIEDLWLPVAKMRDGYCEYNCNLCGEVCPTDAIESLSLADKQTFMMGMAYFDKDLCIPFAHHEDCLVCEEHCPLPEKAIRFKTEQYADEDGSQRWVKYPFVDQELCIGCGICEFKCPLPAEPGIFVTRPGDNAQLDPYAA